MRTILIRSIAVVVMSWPVLAYGQSNAGALRFTADGQYVIVPAHPDQLDISGALTIEAWVKPDAGILPRGYSSIVSKQMNGTGYMLATNTLTDEVCVPDCANRSHRFRAEVGGLQVRSASEPVIDAWQHVAAVWSSGQLKIYVNGQFDGAIDTGSPIPNSLPLWIGSSPFGDNTNWRGAIDEVRIWAVARTQGEIQSTMDRYLCGDEKGLRAYWSFDEGQGQTLHDTQGPNDGFIVGPEWVEGVSLIKPQGCPGIVNDLVQLDSVQTTFTPPSEPPQAEAPAGTFSILASFTNATTSDMCNPFFRIAELNTGVIRLLRVSVNEPGGGQIQGLGGQLIDHQAILLRSGQRAEFQFDIGLPSRAPFVFTVDMWGTLQAPGSTCPQRE